MKMNGYGNGERHVQAERQQHAPSLRELLSERQAHVRMQIVELFREKKTSFEIARVMNGVLSGGVRSDEAVASLIRKLIVRVVPEEERREHESEMHRRRAKTNHAVQNAARDEAMRKKGMKVWTQDEHEFFLSLLTDDKYVRREQRETAKKGRRERRNHFNHEALVDALNEHFQTTEFTRDHTMSRLEHLRAQAKRRSAEERGLPLPARRKKGSKLLPDELGQLDDTV